MSIKKKKTIKALHVYIFSLMHSLFCQLFHINLLIFRFEAHLEVHAGSIDEEDDEQGIAHMIEHVAFLGSKKREKLLGTGARSNAYTDFHHTVFHIHAPTSTKVWTISFSSFGFLLIFVLFLDNSFFFFFGQKCFNQIIKFIMYLCPRNMWKILLY